MYSSSLLCYDTEDGIKEQCILAAAASIQQLPSKGATAAQRQCDISLAR
jgi:hypothetical protein